MARNYVNEGNTLNYTAAADTNSGDGVALGSVLGVSLETVKNGATGVAAIVGTFELPKLSTAVITQGEMLIWDIDANKFIVASAATGDLLNCAVATEAAGNGALTVRARLCPGSGSISA